MKFQELLEETKKEDLYEKIDEELRSGKWIVKDPILYRGTDRGNDLIQYKDVSDRERRKPVDTDPTVDHIIHNFYKKCYPNLPSRQESIFATTSSGSAGYYGDIHVIFPSKDAKISYRSADPHDLLQSIENKLERVETIWNKSQDTILEDLSIFPEPVSDKIKDFVYFIVEKDLSIRVCPKDLYKFFGTVTKEFKRDYEQLNILNNFIRNLDSLSHNFQSYFEKINRGYPETESYVGEVMIDGEYLQIDKDLYDEYWIEYYEDDMQI